MERITDENRLNMEQKYVKMNRIWNNERKIENDQKKVENWFLDQKSCDSSSFVSQSAILTPIEGTISTVRVHCQNNSLSAIWRWRSINCSVVIRNKDNIEEFNKLKEAFQKINKFARHFILDFKQKNIWKFKLFINYIYQNHSLEIILNS